LGEGLRSCQRAASAHPRDGGLQKLVGDLRWFDDSPALAAAAWKRSAELGDPNGMRAYGEFLARAPMTDEAGAMTWLKRAVAGGSDVAADDIVFILERRAQNVDAQRWRQIATRMRDASPSRGGNDD
jgi:TPR repeat protein